MDITEKIYRSTVHIIANGVTGPASGTGFFFQFKDGDKDIFTVVTNQHMIEGFSKWTFHLRSSVDNSIIPITVNTNDWITHTNVDLAILPFDVIDRQLGRQKMLITANVFHQSQIPSEEIVSSLSSMEELYMVGYPDSVVDTYNNLPVTRRGITATPYKYDFKNEPEFLIDASVYGGSSGSPVFMFNKNKELSDSSVFLLGIVRGVHTHTLSNTQELCFKLPNGLGYVVKSRCLLDLLPELQSYIHQS